MPNTSFCWKSTILTYKTATTLYLFWVFLPFQNYTNSKPLYLVINTRETVKNWRHLLDNLVIFPRRSSPAQGIWIAGGFEVLARVNFSLWTQLWCVRGSSMVSQHPSPATLGGGGQKRETNQEEKVESSCPSWQWQTPSQLKSSLQYSLRNQTWCSK